MSSPALRNLFLAVAAAALAAPGARAQSATLFGSLANFDVINDTGGETEGFEIEIEGIQAQDVVYTFGGTYNRYGPPSVTAFPGGVYVRYMARYDPATGQYDTATPVPTQALNVAGHQCWAGAMGMATYLASGCEHFGVSLGSTPAATTYRWMVADAANPGSLVALGTSVPIPTPSWQILPGAQPADPPVVVADIEPPPPPRPELQFGDAQWVKVYKTELPREVGLDELQSDNAVVPADPANLESDLSILQTNPHRNGGRHRNQGGVNSGSRAVVRRYEFYKYTGAVDPATNEALCIDPTCNTADPSEIGDYIGAQMAAANIGVPSITVTRTGNGLVQSRDVRIKCGTDCSVTTGQGAVVTLTATPSSGNLFTGWSGACSGTDPDCTLTVTDELSAGATFAQLFTVSLSKNNGGTLSAIPNGDRGQLICPGSCSQKFTQGTTLLITATPAAGQRVLGWTGACAGTAGALCTLNVNANATAGATFGK